MTAARQPFRGGSIPGIEGHFRARADMRPPALLRQLDLLLTLGKARALGVGHRIDTVRAGNAFPIGRVRALRLGDRMPAGMAEDMASR